MSLIVNKLQQWAACLAIFCLSGCGVGTVANPGQPPAAESSQSLVIDSPGVWGGEARCSSRGCVLALVEHELGNLALYELSRSGARLIDKHHLAYHPDFAIWLSDTVVVAAVEIASSLEIFDVKNGKLVHKLQIPVGFAPRNVQLISGSNGIYQMLVSPYSGTEVAWVEWNSNDPNGITVKKDKWCEAPWFPFAAPKIPGSGKSGLAVACRGDGSFLSIRGSALEQEKTVKKQLANFPQVPAMAAASPAGNWLYVALETSSKNARIDAETGAIQWLDATPEGSVAVRILPDETVVWAEDGRLKLDRYDPQGRTIESRWLKTSGFSTNIQLVDIDGDNQLDVVVLNSGGVRSDVIFGPLWENAKPFVSMPKK